MAKEACRKLYLQVKTLDREKSALETLSQSLNEENTTLKKLNESLTKNMDASISGNLYRRSRIMSCDKLLKTGCNNVVGATLFLVSAI